MEPGFSMVEGGLSAGQERLPHLVDELHDLSARRARVLAVRFRPGLGQPVQRSSRSRLGSLAGPGLVGAESRIGIARADPLPAAGVFKYGLLGTKGFCLQRH